MQGYARDAEVGRLLSNIVGLVNVFKQAVSYKILLQLTSLTAILLSSRISENKKSRLEYISVIKTDRRKKGKHTVQVSNGHPGVTN